MANDNSKGFNEQKQNVGNTVGKISKNPITKDVNFNPHIPAKNPTTKKGRFF